jgi:hypothetical protein
LFWVVHGAVERLFQYVSFKGWLSDLTYVQQNDIPCTGHVDRCSKNWLSGFRLVDESVDATRLTNENITALLYPGGDPYRDLLSYVYDSSTFSWCDEGNWNADVVVDPYAKEGTNKNLDPRKGKGANSMRRSLKRHV